MFNRKSIYALNKKDPNAIVYTDADGNLIRLTCDDFACAAEFRRWKDWSDSDLRKEENADHSRGFGMLHRGPDQPQHGGGS